MSLSDYGWSSFFETSLAELGQETLRAARVTREHREIYQLATEDGTAAARLSGRLRHRATAPAELPVVGDWVAYEPPAGRRDPARIHAVLPRRSKLSRKVAGFRSVEQILAANIDTVFLVCGLDGDFNLRRIERMLVMARESGARPVVLLNKQDLCPEAAARQAAAGEVAAGAPVLRLSCRDGSGLDAVRAAIGPRDTIALVGSSGAGKSTLINRLSGTDRMRTAAVRARDDRGRHTTTHRELVRLPDGGLLIDSPGIRELQLWADPSRVGAAFDDLERLAAGCRFGDCTHRAEPGCAVRAGVEAGVVAPDRLDSYHRLERELRYLELRQDESAQRLQKRKWRAIHRALRKGGRR